MPVFLTPQQKKDIEAIKYQRSLGNVGYGGNVGASNPGATDFNLSKVAPIGSALFGGTPGPAQPAGGQPPLQSTPQAPTIDYDALIAPALQALDASVAPVQAGYEAQVADIEGNLGRTVAGHQTALGEATASANLTRGERTQETEAAVNEQRRQYAEIGQGLQAKYGGTTGTGAFATELAGVQTTRNIGAYRQGLSNAVQKIDNTLEQVRIVTDMAISDAQDKAHEQKLQAKAELERNLNTIRAARGDILARKATLYTQAIQIYQQTLAQVERDNTAFQQQLFLQAQDAQQKLQLSRLKATEATKQFQATTIGVTPEGFSIYGGFNPYTGETQPFNTPGSAGLGGQSPQITDPDERELLGLPPLGQYGFEEDGFIDL